MDIEKINSVEILKQAVQNWDGLEKLLQSLNNRRNRPYREKIEGFAKDFISSKGEKGMGMIALREGKLGGMAKLLLYSKKERIGMAKPIGMAMALSAPLVLTEDERAMEERATPRPAKRESKRLTGKPTNAKQVGGGFDRLLPASKEDSLFKMMWKYAGRDAEERTYYNSSRDYESERGYFSKPENLRGLEMLLASGSTPMQLFGWGGLRPKAFNGFRYNIDHAEKISQSGHSQYGRLVQMCIYFCPLLVNTASGMRPIEIFRYEDY